MNAVCFKNKYMELMLHDEILFVSYAPRLHISLEIAKECVAERIKISEGRTYPMLIDLKNLESIDCNSREYLAAGDAIKYISAGAILVHNSIMKTLATIFIMINRPPIPTRFFTNKNSALKWLDYYKRQYLN